MASHWYGLGWQRFTLCINMLIKHMLLKGLYGLVVKASNLQHIKLLKSGFKKGPLRGWCNLL